jgi:CO/xanthine dehydrogenase Mo-binding subunit
MTELPRREFLKAGGALLVGFGLRDAVSAQTRASAAGPPDPKLIDSWLAIHSDNTATVYVGFAELGQGNSTALLQIAAEELDLALDQVETAPLDTDVSPNQGGTYSSASIARGGPQIRAAAAEARLALLQMAAGRLNAPLDSLTVSRGVVTAGRGSMQVTYGELVGDRRFGLPIT